MRFAATSFAAAETTHNAAAVPTERREHAQLLLGIVRLMVSHRGLHLPSVAEKTRQLLDAIEAPEATRPELGDDLRALALNSLAVAESWAANFADARRHLELSRTLAQRTRRPYLEVTSLAYQAVNEFFLSFEHAGELAMRAVVLAEEHGWTEEPTLGPAYMILGGVGVWQGRLAEAEPWIRRAGRAIRPEAIARDTLGDTGGAERALEHALDLAEPNGAIVWFLMHPAPDLLSRHSTRRTRHASLIARIQNLLAGRTPVRTTPPPVLEPLSDSEIRVLRYLPTNLSTPEIANELSVSRNTVKTHIRNLYQKLGVHRRTEAVTRARTLGLLAPSAHRG